MIIWQFSFTVYFVFLHVKEIISLIPLFTTMSVVKFIFVTYKSRCSVIFGYEWPDSSQLLRFRECKRWQTWTANPYFRNWHREEWIAVENRQPVPTYVFKPLVFGPAGVGGPARCGQPGATRKWPPCFTPNARRRPASDLFVRPRPRLDRRAVWPERRSTSTVDGCATISQTGFQYYKTFFFRQWRRHKIG